jgi:hypothetical protein
MVFALGIASLLIPFLGIIAGAAAFIMRGKLQGLNSAPREDRQRATYGARLGLAGMVLQLLLVTVATMWMMTGAIS